MAATLAYVAYGLALTSFGRSECAAMSGATITAVAPVASSWPRYFGLDRNAIAPAPADSSVATRSIATEPSPSRVASVRAASSERSMRGPRQP